MLSLVLSEGPEDWAEEIEPWLVILPSSSVVLESIPSRVHVSDESADWAGDVDEESWVAILPSSVVIVESVPSAVEFGIVKYRDARACHRC